jgi:phenylalanyl-tRNA synthetase beta chain
VRLPYSWLCELVSVPATVDETAAALALRGFEVASIDRGRQPVIDFEITANRPDCLSVIGLAREAAAAFGLPLQLPDLTGPPAGEATPIDVAIEDADLCPRYCAQVFEVRAAAAPAWMRERLEAAGVRSISTLVDVTNYVMLEMGQPTHAFDYEKLGGRALRIRRAKPGETIRTLDGVDRALEPDMLVIADGERPQAIGGVMGGASSEIGAGTKLMVLESACFTPASVRRTSKRLGLKTEASTRFERGADIDAAPAAIARAAVLLQQMGAAQPLGPMVDRYPSPRRPLSLTLRASRIARVLGSAVPDAAVPRILEPLGFTVTPNPEPRSPNPEPRSPNPEPRSPNPEPRSPNPEPRPLNPEPRPPNPEPRTPTPEPRTSNPEPGRSWRVTVPTFRVDVLREIDLIEEVARHDGYVGLPATFPALTAPQPPPDARTVRDRHLRQVLTACGMSEAMTFSFIEASAAAPFAANHPQMLVSVANPLSEKFAVLRPSLLPGLVDAAAHNRRREHHDVRLFEVGTCFAADGETRAVAGVWTGAGSLAHWSGAARPADFFDVKGVVEAIANTFGIEVAFEPASVPYLVPGRCAEILRLRDRRIGLAGQIATAVADARGFPAGEPLYAFELSVDALAALQRGDDLRAAPLPRFPSIVRDLSVLVDDTLPAGSVRGTIRSAAPDTLTQVIEFDRYRGKGVPEGRVSLSLRLTFRSPERTLTDAEVDAAMDRIVGALMDAHGAVRR